MPTTVLCGTACLRAAAVGAALLAFAIPTRICTDVMIQLQLGVDQVCKRNNSLHSWHTTLHRQQKPATPDQTSVSCELARPNGLALKAYIMSVIPVARGP